MFAWNCKLYLRLLTTVNFSNKDMWLVAELIVLCLLIKKIIIILYPQIILGMHFRQSTVIKLLSSLKDL